MHSLVVIIWMSFGGQHTAAVEQMTSHETCVQMVAAAKLQDGVTGAVCANDFSKDVLLYADDCTSMQADDSVAITYYSCARGRK